MILCCINDVFTVHPKRCISAMSIPKAQKALGVYERGFFRQIVFVNGIMTISGVIDLNVIPCVSKMLQYLVCVVFQHYTQFPYVFNDIVRDNYCIQFHSSRMLLVNNSVARLKIPLVVSFPNSSCLRIASRISFSV